MSTDTEFQQALLLTSKHGNFEVGSRNIPTPGQGQLLVKIHATSLNPIDWKIQKFGRFIPDDGYPAVLGFDVSGEVVKVGDEVTGFEKGDRVLCPGHCVNDQASFQQYTLSAATTTCKIPKNLSFIDAATIPTALACAYIGFYNTPPNGFGLATPFVPDQKNKNKGEPIVIIGGSSSVGQYAIQLASLSGFSPIITTSSDIHTGHLQSLGATHVLDRHLAWPEIHSQITTILDGKPLKYVFDSIGSAGTQENSYALLVAASGGRGTLAVTILPAVTNKQDGVEIVQAVATLTRPENQDIFQVMYRHLESVLAQGWIVPNRYEVLRGGLEGIPFGLERLKENQVSGVKLVALPWA